MLDGCFMQVKRFYLIYICLQLLICVSTGLLASYAPFFENLYYISDFLNCACIGIMICDYSNKRIIFSKNKIIELFFGLLLLYILLSILWSDYNWHNTIKRVKYVLGAFVMFIVVRNHLDYRNYHYIIRILLFFQMMNLGLVGYQNFILHLHPDFCNGIFGFTTYANGIEGTFCLGISLLSVIYYIDGKWNFVCSSFFLGVSCVICALAEIKIYFVILAITVLFAIIMRKCTPKRLVRIVFVVCGIVALLLMSYSILSIIMPDNLRVFENIDKAAAYEDRSTYAGRLNTIDFVYRRVFENNFFYSLFGTGLGTSSDNYIYELGKMFSDEGFIGVFLLYLVILVSMYHIIVAKVTRSSISSENFFSGVFAGVIAISVIVWNCTFTNKTYIVFFFLGIGNVVCEEKNLVNNIKNMFIGKGDEDK